MNTVPQADAPQPRFFTSYWQAASTGFLSASQWRRQRRKVIENATPSYVVKETARAMAGGYGPIIHTISEDVDLVIKDGWPVYSIEQTEVIERPTAPTGKRSRGVIESPITPRTCSADQPRTRKSNGLELGIYNPEGLEPLDYLPESMRHRADDLRLFLHILYRQRIFSKNVQRPKDDDFIPLKTEYLRNQIADFGSLKEQMIAAGLVESDGHYIKGSKSFGYRLCERWRGVVHRKVQVANPRTRRAVSRQERQQKGDIRLPILKWLRGQLDRVTIDYQAAVAQITGSESFDAHMGCIQAIMDRDFGFTLGTSEPERRSGRVYHAVNRLWSPLRKHLRVDGKKLVNIDIRNAQPLFLAVLLERSIEQQKARNTGSYNRTSLPPLSLPLRCTDRRNINRYRKLCVEGQLYDFLAIPHDWDRRHAKQELLTMFYSRNKHQSEMKKLFREEFPEVYAVITEAKKKDHTRLAIIMQKAEADFVIHTVCERIRKTDPSAFVATIHDSVLTTAEHEQLVLGIVAEEFMALGIEPAPLKIERY